MRCEMSHNDHLPRASLREHDVLEKGLKDVAIRTAVDCHRGDQSRESHRPQHGNAAATLDGLGGIGPLAAGRPGPGPGHGQVAARFIEKALGSGGQRCESSEAVNALPLDIWACLLGGATRFLRGSPSVAKPRRIVAGLTVSCAGVWRLSYSAWRVVSDWCPTAVHTRVSLAASSLATCSPHAPRV
jgi:hypothetical protein